MSERMWGSRGDAVEEQRVISMVIAGVDIAIFFRSEASDVYPTGLNVEQIGLRGIDKFRTKSICLVIIGSRRRFITA